MITANVSYHKVHSVPSILPSMSHLSDLMIKDRQEQTKHGDVSKTLTQLKERIWNLRTNQRI